MSVGTLPDCFVGSPTVDPRKPLDWVLGLCRQAGLRHFEAMVGWADSALDLDRSPKGYRDEAAAFGIGFTSMHLPAVKPGSADSLSAAVGAVRFASGLGAETVILKATDIDTYAAAAGPVLDAAAAHGLTTVITNHAGSALSVIADIEAALERVADERLQVLLEVGHFHTAGERWQTALERFAGRIGLVHFKDVRGTEPVAFGEGEIDLDELFGALARAGYAGRLVIEMEGVAPEQVPERFMDGVGRVAAAWARSGAT